VFLGANVLLKSDAELAAAIKEWGPVAQREWARLEPFELYFDGIQRKPYEPATATREFKELVARATTNLTRLVVNTMTQRLIVDGYRPSQTSVENAPAWDWWQANGLDARQKALYDEAAKNGYAGAMVLPGEKDGEPVPVIRPVSPREWWIGFEDYSDDWPFLALKQGQRAEVTSEEDLQIWHVLDENARYVVRAGPRQVEVIETTEHGLGVVPIVPFRNQWNLTRYPDGEVGPCMPIQDRLNQTVFDLLVAQTYAAAPQKWATGLYMQTDADGNPVVDLAAFSKSLWITGDENAKFGSLPEANLKNIVEAIEQSLRVYGLLSQTPPHYLLGDLVNLPLALDTMVPTPTGSSTIGELRIGDQVLAPNGTAVDVVGKSPVHLGHDCYRLRFDSGAEVVADAEHRWLTTHFTSPNNAPYKHGSETSVVTTAEIAGSLKTCMGTNNHFIDVAEPFDGPEVDVNIPPYVLGVWLGNGDHINGVITEHMDDAEEVASHMRDCGELVTIRPYTDQVHINCRLLTVSYDHERCPRGHERPRGTKTDGARCLPCGALRYRETRYGETMPAKTNISFKQRLKQANLWRNKHIPEAYFHGSVKQRLGVVQGLMDTDGSTTPGGTVTFTSHNSVLAHDFARMVRSLGMKVKLRKTDGKTFDKTGTVTSWRMSWSGSLPLFLLARKAARQQTDLGGRGGRSNAPLRHYIAACERVPSVPVQCIRVDTVDHLFLATEHHVSTRNSAEALLAADTTLAKKVKDRQTLFGEAWEQVFRLAGVAAGDETVANDTDAQIWWRDTDPRSIAQQVDALGKMATMLNIPPSALWEKVPDTTGADLMLWRTEAAKAKLQAARQGLTQAPQPVPVQPDKGTPGSNVQRELAAGR
jgi:hypothetical protein